MPESCNQTAQTYTQAIAGANTTDEASRKLKFIVADPGKYLETLRQYAGGTIVVLPNGIDWTPVIESDDPLNAIISLPLARITTGGVAFQAPTP